MILMEEEYRQILEFPNYLVSNLGNVWNNMRGIKMKGGLTSAGYVRVSISKANKSIGKYVHILVARALLDNPENKKWVDHIDGDPTNNRLNNLRFATPRENGQNKKLSKRNTSGVKGVSFSNALQKWKASISVDGISVHLGYFNNIEDAQLARVKRANEAFGVYTHSIKKL